MDIQSILAEYDSMLGKSSEKELSDFLSRHLKEAEAAGDKGAQVALNNELVGITRHTGDLKAAMKACGNVSHLMNELGLTNTREYAIALINMATTYRVYGLLDEAGKRYDSAKELIDELKLTDPVMQSLYNNNIALLHIDKGEYQQAKEHLEKALSIVSSHPEMAGDKEVTLKNLDIVNARLSGTHMDKCREFYETYVRPMIAAKFPDYADRIAAGLVGEGSECFGFDDEYSKDHDYEIGFCLWLSQGDYDAIGEALGREYDALIAKYGPSVGERGNAAGRHGVFSAREYYAQLLRIPRELAGKFMGNRRGDELTAEEWMSIDEMHLAAAVNGAIFAEGDGTFTRIRKKLLEYYPEDIRKMRLAIKLHEFSQSGQYNYARMMARQDYVTARICLGKAMDAGMEILYLLNKTYAPYYKWRRKGLERFGNTAGCREILDRLAILPVQKEAWKDGYKSYEVNRKDEIASEIEELAGEILRLMKEQDLVTGDNTFLDAYVKTYL